jgi:hypothetical protein
VFDYALMEEVQKMSCSVTCHVSPCSHADNRKNTSSYLSDYKTRLTMSTLHNVACRLPAVRRRSTGGRPAVGSRLNDSLAGQLHSADSMCKLY